MGKETKQWRQLQLDQQRAVLSCVLFDEQLLVQFVWSLLKIQRETARRRITTHPSAGSISALACTKLHLALLV